MSQGSTVMPTTGTVSGLTFSGDINAGMAALLSMNSGNSAPANGAGAAPVTGELWLDTSTTPNGIKIYDGMSWNVIGYMDVSGHVWEPPVGGGTDTLASAGTADLWSKRTAYVSVTGTTTITALASVSAVPGTVKVVRFAGALTLTHNATSLILPNNGSNITTAAGDSAVVLALTSTNVAVVAYVKADGTTLSTSSNFTGAVNFNGIISPAALGANTNDWNPSGLATANTIRFSASTPIALSGITAPATDGKVIVLHNIGTTNNVTITDQDANSTAANRFILPYAIGIRPLESVTVIYDATTARWRLKHALRTQPVAGGFKFLRVFNTATPYGDSAPATPNNQMSIVADAIMLEDVNGLAHRAMAVSLTLDVTTSGANGLDTGSVAASTWYSIWVIYNPTTNTVAGLLSASATAPTMPSGYTFKARVGWNVTDGSNHFLRLIQSGRIAQYVVGTNPASIVPLLISIGTVGTYSATSPTLASTSVAAFVPTTASRIHLLASNTTGGSTASVMVAPNSAWGGTNRGPLGSVGNIYPCAIDIGGANTHSNVDFWMGLESTNIAIASTGGAAGGAVACLGWEDAIN